MVGAYKYAGRCLRTTSNTLLEDAGARITRWLEKYEYDKEIFKRKYFILKKVDSLGN